MNWKQIGVVVEGGGLDMLRARIDLAGRGLHFEECSDYNQRLKYLEILEPMDDEAKDVVFGDGNFYELYGIFGPEEVRS